MTDEKREKLFGRYHDLTILLIGFVLTTVLGGYLTSSWQLRSARIQRQAEQMRTEQAAASRIFEDLSRLMDKRLYRMRRVHTGLGSDVSRERMQGRWTSYRDVLFEWNENLNRNLALVQRYFGDGARSVLENNIQAGFREFGQLLEGSGYPDNAQNSYQYRQKVADDLNNMIYNFDIDMITAIQAGDIGAFKQESQ